MMGNSMEESHFPSFQAGAVYNRKNDLHGVYGGQSQGGMSTPASYPVVFLFTGDGGADHGYVDGIRSDGTYWYTGEGQRGDMAFVRSNRALRDHHQDGKKCYLFEAVGRGPVRFVSEAEYIGHHIEERPDTHGDMRKAIVFELGLLPTADANHHGQVRESTAPYRLTGKTLGELRRLALTTAPPRAVA